MKNNKKGQDGATIGTIAFVTCLLIGIIIAFMGFESVDANHLGVKVRFGKITGTMEPGMEWVGIFTDVHQYDMRFRKAEVDMTGGNSAVDKTGQAVYATINVNYKLKADKQIAIELYSKVGNDDDIDERLNLEAIIREGFKQATVKYEALEILDKREEVKQLAIENVKRNFPSEYFEIVDIVVTNIDFSEAFKLAIEQKKTAEQNALKEENQLDVVKFQQQQEIEKYRAEAEKARLQYTAETEKLRAQSVVLSQQLIQKAWIEKWDGHLPQYIIGQDDALRILVPIGDEKGKITGTTVVD